MAPRIPPFPILSIYLIKRERSCSGYKPESGSGRLRDEGAMAILRYRYSVYDQEHVH